MVTTPRRKQVNDLCGWKPVDTLDSAELPSFHKSADMVHEREPPRLPSSQKLQDSMPESLEAQAVPTLQPSQQDRANQQQPEPQFGQTSSIQNPLKKPTNTSVFNVPKPGARRPEHHRPANPFVEPTYSTATGSPAQQWTTAQIPLPQPLEPPTSASQKPNISKFRVPPPPWNERQHVQPQPRTLPDVYEIPRPTQVLPRTTLPAPRPVFSSAAGFRPVNAFKDPRHVVDLTSQDDEDGFDPSRVPGADDRFGAWDPSNYVDAAHASENIKALLEGAFDDEDDKPKTRLRRRKKQAEEVKSATARLQALDVNAKPEEKQALEEEEDDGSVDGLKVKLLPHQIDGVAWMIDKEIGERKKNGVLPKGGILADDMGLGKTIQALSLILSNPRPPKDAPAANPKRKIPEEVGNSTLVVAPLALIKQWESEIKDKVEASHNLKVLVHHGQTRTKRFEDLKKYNVVITTYHTLISEHESSSPKDDGIKAGCFGIHWYRVILDEAHSIKNRNAKMTKAACALKSVYRWCMTGTPMQNNLDELQSLIHFLQIKPYNNLASWRDQIIGPMKNGRGGLAIKRLQYFLKAFMKRRTKEVLQQEGGLNFGRPNQKGHQGGFQIVARNVRTIVAEFDGAEREFYDKLAARTKQSLDLMMSNEKADYMGALVLLLRLRQICNHPELIRANLRKEGDSLSTQRNAHLDSQPKSNSSDEVDDIADMLGSLSVKNQKCNVCQTKLTLNEISASAARCSECVADLNKQRREAKKPKQEARKPMRGRKIVEDDEDDEGEGDWVVPNERLPDLGRARGSDDEDAEGGGEWLRAEDSDSDDESTDRVGKFSKGTTDSFIDYNQTEEDAESDNSSFSDDEDMVPSTKIRQLVKILKKESDKHKFIVFSEFTSMLDIIEPFLQRAGFRYTRYDGKMKNDDREASLKRLREDSRTRILLCSLRCGSLGLNLTAASRVVIIEPFWNPFVEEQAIDRVHRLNQTEDVTVYRLTIANSVEERIMELQEKKRELAKVAIEGGKAAGKLSMKDILHLFRRDAEHGSLHEDVMSLGFMANGLLGASPAKKSTLVASTQRQEPRRDQPRWQLPPSLQGQYGDIYGRRW